MANLVIKNNTGTASSITFDNKSGSDWKIINNNGTFTLNGKSTNWLTISDTGIAKFAGRVAIKMDPDTGSNEDNFAASALTVSGAIAAYNGNIRAIRNDDSNVMLWCENTIGSIALMVHKDKKIMGLLHRRPKDQFLLWYDLTEDKYKQIGTTFVSDIYVNGFVTAQADTAVERAFQAVNSLGKVAMLVAKNGNRGLFNYLPGENKNHYMLYYNVENERQQLTSTYFTGTPYVANSTYWPSINFTSSNKDEEPGGTISLGMRSTSTQTVYNTRSFYFKQFSYKSNSLTRLETYERFKLPTTAADLATSEDYYILTTKPSTATYTMSRLRLTATTDADVATDNETALIIGNRSGIHLTMDGNEIIAKQSEKTAGPLYLNNGAAGHVHIGSGGLSVGGTEYTGDTYTIVAYGPIRAVDANISSYSNSATARNIYVENTNGKVALNLSSDGNRGLYNSTTGSWMLYYNEEHGRQQQGSTYFTGTPYVANSTYWPSMNFISSNLEEKSMGQIAYGYRTSDSKVYDLGRFYFYEYSYKTNTKTRIDYTEAYRLPAVTPDLTASHSYNILTTKNLVTVGQGGTGKSSWTKNRLVWTSDTDTLTGGNHWADSSHIGVNMTSAPETALGVGGSITANGSIISDRTASTTADAIVRAVADTTDAWVQARNTNGTISLRISSNMGIWDSVSEKWMIYSIPGETLVRIPGSLSTPQIKLSSTSAVKHLEFSRGGMNYITTPASGSVNFCLDGAALSSDNCQMSVYPDYVKIRTPLALTTDCYGTSRPSSGSYTGQIFFEY